MVCRYRKGRGFYVKEKILIIGADGFIGKYVTRQLESDYVIEKFNQDALTVDWEQYIKNSKPEYLINLAWRTGQGYLDSHENVQFVRSGLELYDAFYKYGGKRAVFIGTEQEYKYSAEPQKESSCIMPLSLYAKCKSALGDILVKNSEIENHGFVWCRLFFVYGYGEKWQRLMPSLINSMLDNKDAECSYEGYVRDYIYVKDVASAICKCLFSDYTGFVNIAGGEKTTIGDIGNTIKKLTGSKAQITYKKESECRQNMCSCGDISVLKSLGWKKQYSLEQGLIEEIEMIKNSRQE